MVNSRRVRVLPEHGTRSGTVILRSSPEHDRQDAMTRRVTSDTAPRPASPTPQPGDVLMGKYRIDRKVGSGGMGVVFAVTNLLTDRPLAIKWLARSPAEHDALRRFKREAKIAGRIRHPHVVDIHDVHLQEEGCFLVMELLEGESLAAHLERCGPIPPRRACEILLPCMSAVAAAHAAHVIHRDLKPDNIFLCGDDRAYPKLLDFGISRMRQAADTPNTTETRAGTLLGTPAYMAPEQLLAAPCDARTDLYALGVTMYEMLSGARAFDGSTYAALTSKIIHGEVVPLSQRAPHLPAPLVGIVTRAMHRRPEERFADVATMADVIRSWLSDPGGAEVVAQPALRLRLGKGSNRRWQVAVAAVGALVLAAVAVGIGIASSERGAKPVEPVAEARAPVAPRAAIVLPAPEPPRPVTVAPEVTEAPPVEASPSAPAPAPAPAKPKRDASKRRPRVVKPAVDTPTEDPVPQGPSPKPPVRIEGI